jgi:hypothetical protein
MLDDRAGQFVPKLLVMRPWRHSRTSFGGCSPLSICSLVAVK